MPETLDYHALVRMLEAAAGLLKEHREAFSRLDSATGDGDHGTAVAKVADAVAGAIARDESRNPAQLLKDIGWAVLSTDAGSTSPLYGSLFIGMSEATPGEDPIDAAAFTAMFAAGVAKLRRHTRAEVGDKTMIDALAPALEALRAATDGGAGLMESITAAAEAAERGAASTKALQARFGRARNIGERSIGHIDPGAASMAQLCMGLKKGLEHG